jgi:glycosyltransferase involved in cell wall biosynthesis
VALIPAYQPTAALTSVVADLLARGCAVVVVNDGSSPQRAGVFDQLPPQAVVLAHPKNQGKGAALRTGLAWIAERYPPQAVVVCADADGQHLGHDIAAVCLAAYQAGPDAGVVLGARRDDATTPLRSRVGHAVTRAIFRLVARTRLTDTQTGLRAFHASLIPRLLAIKGQRYDFEMSMLVALAHEHVPLREVAITTVYTPDAVSHYRGLTDTWRIARNLIAFAASSLLAFAVDYVAFTILTVVLTGLGVAGPVVWANLAARVVSAGVNYTINSRHVFRRGASAGSALRYAVLALAILGANTAVLSWLTGPLALNPSATTRGVELAFFVVSWLLQRYVVFAQAKPSRPGRGRGGAAGASRDDAQNRGGEPAPR